MDVPSGVTRRNEDAVPGIIWSVDDVYVHRVVAELCGLARTVWKDEGWTEHGT